MLVLIIDDSRSSLCQLLRLVEDNSDVTGKTFDDSALALEAAAQTSFDLVIVDHVMPGMDGITVIQRLRRMTSYAQVPIVMLTASTSQAVRLEALEAGATDFLPKTSNGLELAVKIRNLVALSRAVKLREQHASLLAREVEAATRLVHEREEEMIFRLSLAVEYRDNDTGEHTLRVAHSSRMIAEELGLDAGQCRAIYLAAPLHDVGKVAIPDHVLLKPGRLTDEETAIVRTHAEVGERILRDSTSDLLRLAADIAGCHHERWDGQGYPKGIAGEAIPIAARIVAVADAFDAMTSVRPYKDPMTVEAALACIADEKGRHFDPRCVEAFLALQARALRPCGDVPPQATGAPGIEGSTDSAASVAPYRPVTIAA